MPFRAATPHRELWSNGFPHTSGEERLRVGACRRGCQRTCPALRNRATWRSIPSSAARHAVNERRPGPPETVLSEPAAARLLARASELDAALKGGTSIATLRAAAAEAGISSTAFETALAEAQAEGQPQGSAAATRRRPRLWSWLAGASLLVVGILTVAVQRSVGPAGTIERSLQVRCLSPQDAAELIRPYLDRTSAVSIPPSPDVLRIRATPAQIDRIRALLDRAEDASTSCVSR